MRKNRLVHFAAAITAVVLCLASTHVNAADKPVANPPPEDFLKKLDPQMLEVVDTILKTKSPPLL